MLARLNNSNFEIKGTLVLAAAVYRYTDRTEYICVANTYQQHPYICTASDITVLDDWVLPGWKEDSYASEDGGVYTIASFKSWAENPLFLNWLIEDEWQPERSMEAHAILAGKLKEYVNAYAIKIAGSITVAKRMLIESRFEQRLKDYSDKGYELPDEPDVSDNMLESMTLEVQDLNDLMRLSEAKNRT